MQLYIACLCLWVNDKARHCDHNLQGTCNKATVILHRLCKSAAAKDEYDHDWEQASHQIWATSWSQPSTAHLIVIILLYSRNIVLEHYASWRPIRSLSIDCLQSCTTVLHSNLILSWRQESLMLSITASWALRAVSTVLRSSSSNSYSRADLQSPFNIIDCGAYSWSQI